MPHVIGLNSIVLESKLVDAVELGIQPIVYLASIRHEEDKKWIHFCTAYYISTNFFLTLRLCINKIEAKIEPNPQKVRIFLKTQKMKGHSKPYKIIHMDAFDDYQMRRKRYCLELTSIPKIDVGLIRVSEIFTLLKKSSCYFKIWSKDLNFSRKFNYYKFQMPVKVYHIIDQTSSFNWGAQSKRKVNIVVIEKWNIKTIGAKGKQIFFSGEAKQNNVRTKKWHVFFSIKAQQNEVEGKEWIAYLAFAPTLKRDTLVTLFP